MSKKLLTSKKSFDEELEDFSKKLLSSMNEDFNNGQKPDVARMNAFTKLVSLIKKNSKKQEAGGKP